MKKTLFCFIAALIPALVFGFHGAITGRVNDHENNPLAGAQVWLESFPIGTTTDSSGEYFLEVPMHGVFKVVYQFIGFKSETLTVEVGHGTTLRRNITLQPVILPVPPVEIHATRPTIHAAKTPEPATIIPQTAAAQAGKTTIGEAATLEPGIQLQKRCSACEASELSIQGLPGRFSLVLLEGMPLFSNLASRYILDILPVEFLDRLEIVKGASGAIWGSDAVAGALNVILPEPAALFQGKINYTRRSYGNDLSTSLGSNLNPLGILALGTNSNRDFVDFNSDGVPENTAFHRTILLSRVQYYPGVNVRLNLGGSFADELRRAGANIPDSEYYYHSGAEKVHTRRLDFWQATRFTAGKTELQFRLAAAKHRETGVVEMRDYSAHQTTFYTDFITRLSHLISGTSFSRQFLSDTRLFQRQWENDIALFFAGQNLSLTLFSVPTELLPAIRFDLNSNYGLIPSLYGGTKLNLRLLDLNLAAGTGFRTPTVIFESMENLPGGYQYALRRDPDITRESGISFQSGAARQFIFPHLIADLRLNLFRHQVKNMITADLTGVDTTTQRAVFYYHNLAGATYSTGVEIATALILFQNLTANINGYLLSPETSSDSTLPYVKRWEINYSLTYRFPNWQMEFNTSGGVNGPMLIHTLGPNGIIEHYDSPVYSVLNIRLAKEIGIFRLAFGVNNIGDFRQPPVTAQHTEYYWGPHIGREFYGTVSVNFEK